MPQPAHNGPAGSVPASYGALTVKTDYEQVKFSRQRYLDRLTRQQRRIPLLLTPLLTPTQAHDLMARYREQNRKGADK